MNIMETEGTKNNLLRNDRGSNSLKNEKTAGGNLRFIVEIANAKMEA